MKFVTILVLIGLVIEISAQGQLDVPEPVAPEDDKEPVAPEDDKEPVAPEDDKEPVAPEYEYYYEEEQTDEGGKKEEADDFYTDYDNIRKEIIDQDYDNDLKNEFENKALRISASLMDGNGNHIIHNKNQDFSWGSNYYRLTYQLCKWYVNGLNQSEAFKGKIKACRLMKTFHNLFTDVVTAEVGVLFHDEKFNEDGCYSYETQKNVYLAVRDAPVLNNGYNSRRRKYSFPTRECKAQPELYDYSVEGVLMTQENEFVKYDKELQDEDSEIYEVVTGALLSWMQGALNMNRVAEVEYTFTEDKDGHTKVVADLKLNRPSYLPCCMLFDRQTTYWKLLYRQDAMDKYRLGNIKIISGHNYKETMKKE